MRKFPSTGSDRLLNGAAVKLTAAPTVSSILACLSKKCLNMARFCSYGEKVGMSKTPFYVRVDRLEVKPERCLPIMRALATCELGELVLVDFQHVSGKRGETRTVRKVRVGRLVADYLLLGEGLSFCLPTSGYVQYRFPSQVPDNFTFVPMPISETLDEVVEGQPTYQPFRLASSNDTYKSEPDTAYMCVWLGKETVLDWLTLNLQPTKMNGILRRLHQKSF